MTPFHFRNHSLHFGGEAGGGSPVFDAELWINVLEMFAYRGSADPKDLTNLRVRFSAGEPVKDLNLARRARAPNND